MPIPDLAAAYQTKTDEELLHLAENPEQLTPEAHFALKSELAKRRIDSDARLNVREEKRGKRTPAKHKGDAASP
jgi:hypothetical protein